MSFNSRTRNWKVTEGDPSFCNENNIKNSGQFRNQTKRLNTYAKKFITLKARFYAGLKEYLYAISNFPLFCPPNHMRRVAGLVMINVKASL